MRSPEIPPRPHITSKIQNGPNYHFRLGLFSVDEPPDTHHENPPQVFQYIEQNFIMEGHHPSHYLLHKILLRWLWKNLNQEVHLLHLPHILSLFFSCFALR